MTPMQTQIFNPYGIEWWASLLCYYLLLYDIQTAPPVPGTDYQLGPRLTTTIFGAIGAIGATDDQKTRKV